MADFGTVGWLEQEVKELVAEGEDVNDAIESVLDDMSKRELFLFALDNNIPTQMELGEYMDRSSDTHTVSAWHLLHFCITEWAMENLKLEEKKEDE